MLIVQYPMQFSGPPRSNSNPCSAPLIAQANGGSTNTTRVHAFNAVLLPSKHFSIMSRVSYLLHSRRPGHS